MTKTPQQSTQKPIGKLLSGEFVQASDLLARHITKAMIYLMLDTNKQSLLHFAMSTEVALSNKKWTPQCMKIYRPLYKMAWKTTDKDGLTPFMYAVDVTLSRSGMKDYPTPVCLSATIAKPTFCLLIITKLKAYVFLLNH